MSKTTEPLDILNETVLTMGQAARLFPSARHSRHVHVTTITRWIIVGKKVNGVEVKLEGVQLPGGLRTSREAINRFLDTLKRLRDTDGDPVNLIQSPRQVDKATKQRAEQTARDRKQLREALKTL